MKKTNHYSVLEVSKDATLQEIKDSYKQLAKKYHPDNQDSGDAVKMSALNEAYNTLKNPKSKAEYDSTFNGSSFGNFNYGFQSDFDPESVHVDLNNINKNSDENLENIFRGFGRDKFFNEINKPIKPKDVEIEFEIELEQAYAGFSSNVTVKLHNGEIRTLQLDIPQGADTGDKIVFEGMGNLTQTANLKNSNLYVVIKVLQHEHFKREKQDILTNVSINSFEAMLGTTKTIEMLDASTITINIPAGTQPGATIKVPNQGMPKLNSISKGKLIVAVIVKTPTLSQEQKQILQNLKFGLD